MADNPTNLYIRKEDDSGWWVIGGELVFQNASFVTVNAEADLDSERVLTGGNSISLVDAGADTTITVNLDTPGTCTVSTGNAAAAPHTHAVTSSSNPGAAASLLASDASGYVQLTGLGITAAPASNDLHIGTGQGITHADGVAAGNFLRANGTRYVPDTLDIADITDLAYAAPNFTLTTANADGVANTVVRSDASIALFDAVVPTSVAPDDAAAAGAAAVAARRDHTHGFTCAAPTTNLSVSTANAEGAGYNFVRDSHTHAIDSSSSPGAAASILASSAAGKLTLVDLALSSLTASTVIYSDATKTIVSLANAAGYLENDGAGGLSWAAGVAPAAHDILSASHSDTLAGNVTDGDIIIGNGTPKWSELAISVPAANVRNVLGVDNGETRPSWKTALDGNNPATLTVSTAAAPGTSLVFSHRDHAHDITSSSNPGAAASLLASAADGGLQLLRIGLGVDPDTDNAMKVVDDAWIGLGSAAGRFVFDSTPDPDQIDVAAADLYFATSGRGIIHVDGVADGSVLVADGTRYIPGDLSDITGGAAQFLTLAADGTLANERVFTPGDGLDGTDNGAGNAYDLVVDVTDILGNGTAETANNIYVYALRQSDDGAAALQADADGDMTAYGGITFDTAETIATNAGDLTIAPAGDIILNPTGNDVLPTTNYDINLGSVSKKYLDLHTAEVTAGHIVATETASGVGGRIVLSPTCLFAVDLASGTTNSAEKLSNTGFETAGGGGADVFGSWSESAGDGTIGQDATVYHGGAKSCKLTSGATSNTYVYQDIAVDDTTQVILGFWTQGDGVNAGRYRVYDNTNAADILAVASTGVTAATWTKVWYDFDVPANCVSARIYFYCPAVAAGYAYFDDVTAKTGVQITVTDDDMTDVDIAYAEAGGNVEWFEIASAAGGAGPYTYWVLRDLDGGGANNWYAGDAVFNTGNGNSSEGYIDVYTADSVLGTTTNRATIVGGLRNSPTYNDVDETWQLSGNRGLTFLEGTYGSYITWRETNFAGGATGWVYNSWAGGAADDIVTSIYASVPSGLSAGDAQVQLRAADIDAGTNYYLALDSSGSLEITTGADSFINLDGDGQLSIGVDTGPIIDAFMTVGLCINQDTNDDEIIALKASEVGHAMTALANSDTYGVFKKSEATSGGLAIWGYKDSGGAAGYALALSGRLGEAANTTKTTAGVGVVHIAAQVTDGGTGVTTVGADGNLMAIANSTTTRYIFDAEGSAHADIEWTTFDEQDDVGLLDTLETALGDWQGDVVKDEFGAWLKENEHELERLKLVHFDRDNPGHVMLNTTRLLMLLTGACRQLGQRVARYETLLE